MMRSLLSWYTPSGLDRALVSTKSLNQRPRGGVGLSFSNFFEYRVQLLLYGFQFPINVANIVTQFLNLLVEFTVVVNCSEESKEQNNNPANKSFCHKNQAKEFAFPPYPLRLEFMSA